MKRVAVIAGDGIGPEVIREAVKVLDVAAEKFNLKLNYTPYDLGGDRYLRTKEALPDSAVEKARKIPGVRAATGVRRTSVLVKIFGCQGGPT